MSDLLQLYIDLLKWDIAQMSHPWMYYWIIPITFFLPFFFAKWTVLTAPLWLPFGMIYAARKSK